VGDNSPQRSSATYKLQPAGGTTRKKGSSTRLGHSSGEDKEIAPEKERDDAEEYARNDRDAI
jgi:hypothetical protein